MFSFEIIKKDKKTRARAGIIKTSNGNLETPYLIPVATRARIIAIDDKDIKKMKIQALLSNTYHLHLKPGEKIINEKGGLHKFMNFPGVVFTDSGGFQAFSLGAGITHNLRKIGFFPGKRDMKKEKQASFAKITNKGVYFKSVYDNSEHFLGPKESMEIQSMLGSDVIMAFDECTSPLQGPKYIKESMERSHRWESECLKYKDEEQALYGIIHGGWFKNLRIKSTKFILSKPFQGLAVGGSLGKTNKDMYKILSWMSPYFDNRPVHMLGIGRVEDLFECVSQGIDTFDCVETTRIARHGNLYISSKSGGKKINKFRLEIRKSIYSNDKKPIDPYCPCSTCKKYSRKQLHKLFKNKDPKYAKLATIHNISFMHNLSKEIRKNIIKGTFSKMKKEWLKD